AGSGQLHGGVHRDLGLQHAADHALHPVDLGGGGDAEGAGQAAALHQLDVDVVGRPALEDAQGVGGAEHAFVGHHRHPAVAGDVGQALQIADRKSTRLNSSHV